MARNLRQQLLYCIYQCDHRGTSKRADRRNKVDMKGRLYSTQRIKDLKNTAKSLAKFMKAVYPGIKLVYQIRSEHVQDYLNSKAGDWSERTESEVISRLVRLNEITNYVYGIHQEWNLKKSKRTNAKKIRDMAMTREDFNKINAELQRSNSEAKYTTEITARTGARVAEVAGLRVSGINTDDWLLEIREGAKNGNHRDVPIREPDREYFGKLKKEMTARGRIYVTNGVKPQSLDKKIRRTMKELNLADKYPKATDHTIRKMYAIERMEEELEKCANPMMAWEIVQEELGHGDEFRQALYDTYVCAPLKNHKEEKKS